MHKPITQNQFAEETNKINNKKEVLTIESTGKLSYTNDDMSLHDIALSTCVLVQVQVLCCVRCIVIMRIVPMKNQKDQ